MNKQDRKELKEAGYWLDEAYQAIESIKDGESGKYDNLPEGFQESTTGTALWDNAAELEEILDDLDELKNRLSQFQRDE